MRSDQKLLTCTDGMFIYIWMCLCVYLYFLFFGAVGAFRLKCLTSEFLNEMHVNLEYSKQRRVRVIQQQKYAHVYYCSCRLIRQRDSNIRSAGRWCVFHTVIMPSTDVQRTAKHHQRTTPHTNNIINITAAVNHHRIVNAPNAVCYLLGDAVKLMLVPDVLKTSTRTLARNGDD